MASPAKLNGTWVLFGVIALVASVPAAAAQDFDPNDPLGGDPPETPADNQPEPLPDLAVFGMSVTPDEPDDEKPITFCAEFQNYGNAKPGPFSVALLVDGEELTSKRYTQFPDTGDEICVDSRATLGWHTYEVIADFEHEVQETTEENNHRSQAFLVSQAKEADLTLDLILNPDPPKRGQTIAVTARVRNAGAEWSNATTVRFYHNEVLHTERAIGSLAPGGTQLAAIAFDGDALAAGDHTVRVIVDAGGLARELNEDNNEAMRSFALPKFPDPDLALVNVTWDSELRETFVTNFTARIENRGDLGAGTFLVRFLVDNRTVIAAPRLGGLAAGENTTVTVAWQGRAPGPHTLNVIVDPGREVDEVTRTNNERHYRVLVKPRSDEPPAPDLIVERILFLPSRPQPGDHVNVTAVVKNVGPLRAGSFTVGFDINGSRISTARFDALPAGGVVASVAPWRASIGTHNITITADVTDALNESAEDNNAKTQTLVIIDPATVAPAQPKKNATAPPANTTKEPVDKDLIPPSNRQELTGTADLQIASVSFVELTDRDGAPDPRYVVQVFNRGDAVARPFRVQFFVDGELVGDHQAQGLSPRRDIGVSWGKHRDPDFALPPPGPHTLRVVVIPAGATGPTEAGVRDHAFTVNAPEEKPVPFAGGLAALGAVAAAAALARRRRAA